MQTQSDGTCFMKMGMGHSFFAIIFRICCILITLAGCEKERVCGPSLYVESFSIENDVAHEYLENVTYEDKYDYSLIGDFCYSSVPYRKDRPKSIILHIYDCIGYSCRVHADDGEEVLFIPEIVSDDESVSLDNPEPGIYYCEVADSVRKILRFSLELTGRLRMIALDDLYNVRDLGGWGCGANGTIRYGKVFRGSEANGEYNLTAHGESTMRSTLGISAEIDLRLPTDEGYSSGSSIGSDISYGSFPVRAYTAIIDKNCSGTYINAFRFLLDKLNEGRSVYIHCVAGADRTGTFCFLLEGLLGLSDSDLSKEYELSAFYDYRSRSDDREGYDYKKMIDIIRTFEGHTLAEKIESWFLYYGFTEGEISSLRYLLTVKADDI